MIVNRIYLSWRKGKGANRYLVGEILRQQDNSFTFHYIDDEVVKAKKEGFSYYPEFPNSGDSVTYSGDLQSIFSLRLMPESRAERKDFLKFWEASNLSYDWFDELALTQGKLATDNFEFLGDYNYDVNGFRFVTDIAGFSHINIKPGDLSVGDVLSFERDSNNSVDPLNAIKVFKGTLHVGFIKRGHNRYFTNANPNRLHLTAKAIERNGKVNELYVLVAKK